MDTPDALRKERWCKAGKDPQQFSLRNQKTTLSHDLHPDFIIQNSGSLEDLSQQVTLIINKIT